MDAIKKIKTLLDSIGHNAASIGIAITTRNRHDAFEKSLSKIKEFAPHNAVIVVVDDASDKPVKEADYRFKENAGIAKAKNKCLELLYNKGCEHFFLFDDDTYPIAENWYVPYIESPEPHLMWVFDRLKGQTESTFSVIYKDDVHIAYNATRGCMLYCNRLVLDTVGGMNPDFGKWGWEHQSWSDRIHSAGLTTFRYADVVDSSGLIYSMDQNKEVKTTATDEAIRFSKSIGLDLRHKERDSPRYIEFRETRNVIMTSLLTKHDDPQRPGSKMAADFSLISELHKSLLGKDFVVFHTDMKEQDCENTTFVNVHQHINPYFERHIQYYKYLRSNKDIDLVWCVDGTDVTMLRNPFPEMDRGVLYVGYECKTLRDEWMNKNHPDSKLQDFMKSNPNLTLLNAGLIGGDRNTVMNFLHKIIKMYFDDHIDFVMGWEKQRLGVGDMGAFNYVARSYFSDVVSWGAHVNTVFKLEDKNNIYAWWKHK